MLLFSGLIPVTVLSLGESVVSYDSPAVDDSSADVPASLADDDEFSVVSPPASLSV